ncbi:MAG: hypothetical protein Q8M43_02530 [Sulfuricurvum sp.]|uniref:hypothetical protein n=1 Tax=Sulfuricurvum sp. TaxID=2025608 RepID=UPI00273414FA|nr:hypothetical protein [Sulfuricurvum sp.]MDP3290881.1 hypothetical protein [Sulfuricurvum sp.]
MRLIIYAFMFAFAFLLFKAFFLDEYLEEKRISDANTTVEENSVPEVVSVPNEGNVSGMAEEKKESPEVKKMPLDQLGDDLTKHIKL